jgi:hypothetical protein
VGKTGKKRDGKDKDASCKGSPCGKPARHGRCKRCGMKRK